MASTNFAFLSTHDPLFGQLAEAAERSLVVDPNTTLLKLRQLGEAFARHAAACVGLLTGPQATQLDLLRELEGSLGDGVTVVGRIDLVRRKETGVTTIVDLKSTHQAQDERLTDKQLHIYALGYRELTGRDADQVETYHLDDGKRLPRSVDDGLITNVKADVKRAATALRLGRLEATPAGKTCGQCDFKKLCSQAAVK